MGQRLFFPPSVAGWPDGLAWLRGQSVLARANFAAWITEPSTQGDANHLRSLAQRYDLKTSESWADALATLLLGSPPSASGSSFHGGQAPSHLQITRRLLSLPEAQVG
jgi:hypothetical protein